MGQVQQGARRLSLVEKLLLGTAAILGAAPAAQAQTWTGANSTDWFDAGNWSPAVVPLGQLGLVDTTVSAPVIGAGAAAAPTGVLIGNGGVGVLSISNGGALNTVNDLIGFGASATGTVNVSGAGSTWTSTSTIDIGVFGTGNVNVSNGGAVVGLDTTLGEHVGASGTLVITGAGSSWQDAGAFYVGMEGSGDLTVANGGVLTNGNAYIGTVAGSTGVARIAGAGSRWVSGIDLTVGYLSDGALTISDDGLVEAASVQLADHAGSSGLVTIGGVGVADAPGTLSAPLIEFGLGDADLVFNHTSADYAFAPSLVGGAAGGLVSFNAGVTRLTGDSSAFAGEALVTGGSAYFNNLFGGDVGVQSGGVVGGSGSVATLNAGAGGVVAPGNSIGTLSAANAAFAADSIYRVEVNAAGLTDLLDVSGAVTIAGGSVQVIADVGAYGPNTDYTIIEAASVTGAFADATTNYVFLAPTLTYDADAVRLRLTRNAVGFSQFAENANQLNVANALEALETDDPLFLTAVSLVSGGAPSLFAAFSGEAHATTLGAMMQGTLGVMQGTLGVMQQLDGQLMQLSQAPSRIQLASNGADASLRSAAGNRFWAEAYGASGEFDGDASASAYEADRTGLLIGVDHGSAQRGLIGVALGFGESNIDVDGLASSSQVESYDVALYGGLPLDAFILRGAVGYAQRSVDTDRAVTAGALTERLSASYDSEAVSVDVELARPFRTTRGHVEPFLSLAHVALEADGFTETGGASALTVAAADADVTFSTLGARVSRRLGANDATALYGSLGWRHATGDTNPRTNMAFAATPGAGFSVTGAPIAEDAAAVEAGVRFAVAPGALLALGYRGDIADDVSEHSAHAHFSWKF